MPSRREFLTVLGLAPVLAPLTHRAMGVAYTSFAVRMLQGRDIMRTTASALPAAKFLELTIGFGGTGCQIDLSQLDPTDAGSLRTLRSVADQKRLFLELSVPAKHLESADAYDRVAAVAGQLGVARLRVALLSGRRYETFKTRDEWLAFATRWRTALLALRPAIDRHQLSIGIENHKDFLAAELVELLRAIDSPYVGACVDFGNNVALLEAPMDVVRQLAPFAVTTHVKDMAVRAYDDGFELSEVPLGAGFLPLGDMIVALRAAKPDVHLCLEMITRDPLKIPYRTDAYWIPFERRDAATIRRFEDTVLSKAWTKPLPRISNLSPPEQLAAEDENLRLCLSFARERSAW
jgi:3-oxoisoapionate decarboxylase